MSLGEKFRKIRQSKRLSQKEIAEILNIAQSTYHSWENDTTHPTARHFARLVEVLGVRASELMDPNWTVRLSQPSQDNHSEGKTIMEGNALRMFEILSEKQRDQHFQLEGEIGRLKEDVERLKREIKSLTNK